VTLDLSLDKISPDRTRQQTAGSAWAGGRSVRDYD
jgi:hypothetical protein